ncbi:unnamed protein product [Caenorhabditis angaria]|uniref:Uncharacterized protein n=1 Tax=Caenorhabditis angaria TaxID=860376 RepID=A0A9P1IN25_9PELO|nr:unnamed protein product [Caenorhabditis angaria]
MSLEKEQLTNEIQQVLKTSSELEQQVSQFKHFEEQYLATLECLKQKENELTETSEKLFISQQNAEQLLIEKDELVKNGQSTDVVNEQISLIEDEKKNLEDCIEQLNIRVNSITNEFESANKQFVEIRLQKDKEISNLQEQIQTLNSQLSVAEESIAQKENSVVKLESEIESINAQYEKKLAAVDEVQKVWEVEKRELETKSFELATELRIIKEQSNGISGLAEMIESLRKDLANANKRVEEIEETANHDITIMKEEVEDRDIQVGELIKEIEELKLRLAEAEKSLEREKKEVERLETCCDKFDDEERVYKQTIRTLQKEVKDLKGIKTPPRQPGLIEMGRAGIKPLSRETTYIDEAQNEQGTFVDARDSFVAADKSEDVKAPQSTSNQTAVFHPDDTKHETQAANTPSKMNRSRCDQSTSNQTAVFHPDDTKHETQAANTPSKMNRSRCDQQ